MATTFKNMMREVMNMAMQQSKRALLRNKCVLN